MRIDVAKALKRRRDNLFDEAAVAYRSRPSAEFRHTEGVEVVRGRRQDEDADRD
jgi:hypothetical protein